MGASLVLGLVIDAALGGIAIKKAFDEFRKDRDPSETPEDAAAEYAKKMLAEIISEQEADSAVAAWKAKHGTP